MILRIPMIPPQSAVQYMRGRYEAMHTLASSACCAGGKGDNLNSHHLHSVHKVGTDIPQSLLGSPLVLFSLGPLFLTCAQHRHTHPELASPRLRAKSPPPRRNTSDGATERRRPWHSKAEGSIQCCRHRLVRGLTVQYGPPFAIEQAAAFPKTAGGVRKAVKCNAQYGVLY